MLDFDLAELYQVETKRLKEAVRRNIERFEGEDFMCIKYLFHMMRIILVYGIIILEVRELRDII